MTLSTTTNAPSARTATLFKVRERALFATPTVLRAKVQRYAMDAFSGHTLMEGYTRGTCLACKRPCTTCEGSPTYCTSCAAGYSRKSIRCRNNTFVGFRFVIASTPSEILASIDTIISGMLSIMSMNSTQLEAITFESITSGSSILNGALTNDASTQSVTALSSTLSAGWPAEFWALLL